MKTILPLENMTHAEKLRAMEELWADLTRDQEHFESPAWHEEALKERERRVQEGSEEFIPWEKAKRILRDKQKIACVETVSKCLKAVNIVT